MDTTCSSDVNFKTFDFDSVATISNFIDKGAFGDIYGPFTWNSQKCAFKRILISQTKPDDFKIKVKRRKNVWTTLKHKNLLEIHHVSLMEKAVYLVMEYASGGSLQCFLRKSDVSFRVSNWAKQIAEGMLYLHDNDMVHRDLKSGNILIMEPTDSLNAHKEMTLKITDFDEVKEHSHTTTMSWRGTFAYMAPEVLTTQRFSKASDVWRFLPFSMKDLGDHIVYMVIGCSYGVVIREMWTRELPHEGLAEGAIMQKAFSGELTLSIPDSIPEAYKELLNDCLCHNTKIRPSFKNIIDELSNIDSREDIKETNQLENEMNDDERPDGQMDTDTYEIGKYPMDRRPRGLCLIINIANFDKGHRHLLPRSGADRDAELVKELFQDLHFSVQLHHDVGAQTLESIFLAMHIADHTNYDAFVCCVMTHGKLGIIYTSEGREIEILKLVDFFTDRNCPSLKGKPKMFFIQACQKGDREPEYDAAENYHPHDGSIGDRLALSSSQTAALDSAANMPLTTHVTDVYVQGEISSIQNDISNITVPEAELEIAEDATSVPALDEPLPNMTFKHKAVLIPGSPDFLMSFSTLPGSISYRDTQTGSLYIQALNACLRRNMEIDRALKMVSSSVKEKLRQRGEQDGVTERFQLPFHLTSGMDKLIYL